MSDEKRVETGQRYEYLPTGVKYLVLDQRGKREEWNLRDEMDPEHPCFATTEDLLRGPYKLLPVSR